MKNLIYLLTIIALISSCGLTSKYKSGQHAVFAKLLTNDEIAEINRNGEIYRYINFNHPGFMYGTLRIIKTQNPNVFNFVEVGDWFVSSETRDKYGFFKIATLDTVKYDSLGNILSRVSYDMSRDGFNLVYSCYGRIDENGFTQSVKRFINKVLTDEYSSKVIDYIDPKSDIQKNKIPFGVDKHYYLDGTLAYIKTYDTNGKLISEEKYRR